MLPDLDGFEVCRRLRADGDARAGHLPHRPRRHRGQGPRPHHRRRRLRHQAVQPRGARGPRAGRAAPRPARRRRGRAACASPTSSSTRTPTRCGGPGSPSSCRPPSSSCCATCSLNPSRVLSKAQILDHVWQYDFGGDASVVETYISYLRKKVDRVEPRAHPHRPRVRATRCATAGAVSVAARRACWPGCCVLVGVAVVGDRPSCRTPRLRSYLLDAGRRASSTGPRCSPVMALRGPTGGAAAVARARPPGDRPDLPERGRTSSCATPAGTTMRAVPIRVGDRAEPRTVRARPTPPAERPVHRSTVSAGRRLVPLPRAQRRGARRGLPSCSGHRSTVADATLQRLLVVEVVAGVFVLALVGLVASRVVRSGLRPLDAHGGHGRGHRRRRPLASRVDRAGLPHGGRPPRHVVQHHGRTHRDGLRRAGRSREERLRRFVADASHELRTPLTSIRGLRRALPHGALRERPEPRPGHGAHRGGGRARIGVLVDDLLAPGPPRPGPPARTNAGRPGRRRATTPWPTPAPSSPTRPLHVDVAGDVVVLGERRCARAGDHQPAGQRPRAHAGGHAASRSCCGATAAALCSR